MAVATFEGVVEAGQIRLLNGETLPEKTAVYIVVPDYASAERTTYPVIIPPNPRIMSPRLVRKEDAPHFQMEMKDDSDAGV